MMFRVVVKVAVKAELVDACAVDGELRYATPRNTHLIDCADSLLHEHSRSCTRNVRQSCAYRNTVQ
jgi:hypothetical protein